jgi:hypothetical protein
VGEEVHGVSVLRLDDYTPRDQRQSCRNDRDQASIIVTQLESAGIVIDPRTGQLKRSSAIPLKHFAAAAS